MGIMAHARWTRLRLSPAPLDPWSKSIHHPKRLHNQSIGECNWSFIYRIRLTTHCWSSWEKLVNYIDFISNTRVLWKSTLNLLMDITWLATPCWFFQVGRCGKKNEEADCQVQTPESCLCQYSTNFLFYCHCLIRGLCMYNWNKFNGL